MPETVQEEKKEEEEEPTWKRQSRFSVMRDHNEFGKFGEKKRHNSLDGLKKRKFIPANHSKSNAFQSQYGKHLNFKSTPIPISK